MLFSKSASGLRHLQRCHRNAGQALLRCQSQLPLALGHPCHCAVGWGTHKAGSALGGAWGCPGAKERQKGEIPRTRITSSLLRATSSITDATPTGAHGHKTTMMPLHSHPPVPGSPCAGEGKLLMVWPWWGEHLIHWYSCGCLSVEAMWYRFSRVPGYKIIALHRLCIPVPSQTDAGVGAGRKTSKIFFFFLTGLLVLITLTACNLEGRENDWKLLPNQCLFGLITGVFSKAPSGRVMRVLILGPALSFPWSSGEGWSWVPWC